MVSSGEDKHVRFFNKMVDVVGLGLHDYNDIIKNPMDLAKNFCQSPLDFASNVRMS